jgi:hypothetical protein
MFHLLFANDKAIDCDGAEGASEDFCSGQVLDSYLRVYAIVIGDFQLS